MTKNLTLTALACLALSAAPALAEEAIGHPAMSHHGAQADLYAPSRDEMHKNMNVAPTGNPDADFVRNMIPHHEGAIAMARVELEHGKDPELRKLAQDIIDAQDKEIAFMKAWLNKARPAE